MTLDKTQQNALTQKILEALTPAQLKNLLPRQEQLVGDGISDLLKNHSVDEVTSEMIQGQYELVTEVVAPAERILMSEQLAASAGKD